MSAFYLAGLFSQKTSLTSVIFAHSTTCEPALSLIAYGQDEGQTHQNSLPGVIGETCRRPGSKLEAPGTRVSRRGLVFVNKSLQPQALRMRKDAG